MQDSNPFTAPETIEVGTFTQPEELIRLLKIAKSQRALMLCIVSYAISAFLFIPITAVSQSNPEFFLIPITLLGATTVAGLICLIVLTHRVAGVMTAVFFGIGYFIPVLGLLLVLIMNRNAMRILKNAGFKIGLLGANIGHIQQAVESAKVPR